MSGKLINSLVVNLVLLFSVASAFAQQPLAMITVDYDNGANPPRNSELIHKTLNAALAETLKKKLNVNDPATVADLMVMREGTSFRIVIVPKGAVQPTPDEVLVAIRESFLDTVTNILNDLHQRDVRQMREQDELDADLARRKLAETQDQLAKIRSTLRQASHRVDVSPDAL